jgi:hypothetical protein
MSPPRLNLNLKERAEIFEQATSHGLNFTLPM